LTGPGEEPEAQGFDASYYGQNQGELVTVRVPVPKQNAGRSVAPDDVEFITEDYEVVFKGTGASFIPAADSVTVEAGDLSTVTSKVTDATAKESDLTALAISGQTTEITALIAKLNAAKTVTTIGGLRTARTDIQTAYTALKALDSGSRTTAIEGAIDSEIAAVITALDALETSKGTSSGYYYRGTGTATQGYVNVSVPVGTGYKVLLLAGRNHTLLAAGYESSVEIKPNIANIVTINVKTLPLQWNTTATGIGTLNDFTFAVNLADNSISPKSAIEDRYIAIAPNEVGQIAPATDTFTVTFNTAKFTDTLIEAEGGSTLTIQDYKVNLHPRYPGSFDRVSLNPAGKTPGNGPYPLDITNPISFTNVPSTGKLPKVDVDGLVQFELQYYAFGTKDSTGSPWVIRNGLQRSADDTAGTPTGSGNGSYFVVRFGEGSPAQDPTVTIVLDGF
jgi:hypothetical protein